MREIQKGLELGDGYSNSRSEYLNDILRKEIRANLKISIPMRRIMDICIYLKE